MDKSLMLIVFDEILDEVVKLEENIIILNTFN